MYQSTDIELTVSANKRDRVKRSTVSHLMAGRNIKSSNIKTVATNYVSCTPYMLRSCLEELVAGGRVCKSESGGKIVYASINRIHTILLKKWGPLPRTR